MNERRIEQTGRGARLRRVRRLRLAIGLVGASLLLAACSTAPKVTPSGGLPSNPDDLSFPADGSFPPDLSLPPDESLPPDQSFPPDASFSSDLLRHGTATVVITSGEPMTIHMPHLSGDGPSLMEADIGVDIAWRGGDWELRVQGGEMVDPAVVGNSALTLIREDTDTPLQADGSDCTITYTVETPTHVAGHAECTGLQWTDAFDVSPADSPTASGSPASASPAPGSPAIDRPLFNATITFDATP